jgi:hypothetical protein
MLCLQFRVSFQRLSIWAVLLPKGLRYQVRRRFLGCFPPPTRFHFREGCGLSFFGMRVQPDGAIQRDGTMPPLLQTLPRGKPRSDVRRSLPISFFREVEP